MFPSEQFDVSKVLDNDSVKSVERDEGGGVATQYSSINFEGFRKFRGNNLFSSNLGLSRSKLIKECQEELTTDFQGSDYAYLDVAAPSSQSTEDITKFPSSESPSEFIIPEKEIPSSLDFPSFKILKDFTNKSRNMNGRRIRVPSYQRETKVMDDSISTIAIISLAGEKFIQSFSQKVDDLSLLSNPFAFSFMGLSDETSRDVELVQDLLACAEKVAQKQFDSASKLILQCNKLSSSKGSPVRRLTYFFSAALQDKIKKETGEFKYTGTGKAQILDCLDKFICVNPNAIAFHQKVPFSQICQFTAIQTIAENVRKAKHVHIIDTDIRSGLQHIVLMQALAAQSQGFLPQLKITAIGTRSKEKIEETGKKLKNFAESMGLLFSFNVLMVADFLDLTIDLFQLDEEEVAVYSSYFLTTLLSHPDRLDNFMRVMRKIKPCVIVMCEVEANHTTPAFVNRFIEALFYYGAFFDALANCMADLESNRRVLESEFGLMINNIVSAEGTERIIRHINLDVWRAYFARFRMMEADLSSASEYQANMLLKNFSCGSSCTLDMDDKCLVIGWKGVPIVSVSAWKFLIFN